MTASSLTRNDILENFWKLIHNTIDQFAEKEFVVTTNGSITFQQANNLSNKICLAIKEAETKSGVGIGLFLQDPLKIVPGMLGAMKANDYFVVMDTSFPAVTTVHMIDIAEIEVILTDDEYCDRIQDVAGNDLPIVNIDKLDIQHQTPNREVIVRPDLIVQIMFTSGSTGQPKGVIEDYRYLARAMHIKLKEYAFSSDERLIQLSSFSFAGPHTSLFAALITGYTIFIYNVKTEGLIGLKDWIHEKQITIVRATPTVFRNLVRVLDITERFSHVRALILGGEKPLNEDAEAIRRHFPNVKAFRLGFASSETQAVSASSFQLDHKFEDGVLPCGAVMEDIQVYIWDEQGCDLPAGEAGEIVVYGDALARGYMNNPDLTNHHFIPDPHKPSYQYFRTGDLGKIQADGQLVHLGRIDTMVKIKGIRIELSSVEKRILAYPGINQAVLKAIKDQNSITKLAGYFTATHGVSVPLSDLRKHLADHLPHHLLPNYLIQLDDFPTTPTGKIDPNLLPPPQMVRPALKNPYQPPEDELEKALVAIWEELTGIQGIGVSDDFFDVGGDSLIGILLLVEIEKVLGMELPVSVLITAPTIRQQAGIIRDNEQAKYFSPIIPININGNTPPLFFIPGKGGQPTRLRHLAKRLSPNVPVFAMQDLAVHREYPGKAKNISSMAAFYIQQIKTRYPHGPYYLIGESLGGKIALEMALQLHKAGDQVPVLVMLDTYNVNKPEKTNFRGKANKPGYLAMLFDKHFRILRDSNWEGRLEYVGYYFGNLGRKISNLRHRPQPALPAYLTHSEMTNREAAQDYQPNFYSGKVIFFKAALGPFADEPANGWLPEHFGELVIHTLDCYHGSILFEPIVSQIADIIQAQIDSDLI